MIADLTLSPPLSPTVNSAADRRKLKSSTLNNASIPTDFSIGAAQNMKPPKLRLNQDKSDFSAFPATMPTSPASM